MTKYHVNPKTGRTGICKAQKSCPLGDNIPHFDSREAAQEYVEAEAKKAHYSFTTATKSSNVFIRQLNELPATEGEWHAENYLSRTLGDESVHFHSTIEKPDGLNSTLLEREGELYLVNTMGSEWSSFRVLNAHRVKPVTQPQLETVSISVEDTSEYPKINQMLEELSSLPGAAYDSDSHSDRGIFYDGLLYGKSVDKTFDREDGSKIYCFNIAPPGDRSFTEPPAPVGVDVVFSENGERQNARMMDQGYVIYDTRIDQGVLFKYQDGSEGGDQDSTYLWDGVKLQPNPELSRWTSSKGELYVLLGKGSTVDAPYYTHA